MKMKPKPSTMFSAPGSIGPEPRSLNSGNSTAPTTIIPATRQAARKANRMTNRRPISAMQLDPFYGGGVTRCPHPEERALARVSKDGRVPMVRDGARAPPHHEDHRWHELH